MRAYEAAQEGAWTPRARFRLWAALVLACGAWHTVCACSLRARGAADTRCAREPAVCLRWHSVTALSPRWLSDSMGVSGPLVSWVLLAPMLAATGRAALLLDVVLWYLALIMAVRYVHLALPAGWHAWDPSGHIFVYGAQLVPIWLTAHLAPARGPSPRCTLRVAGVHVACGYALVLAYASGATAAFFHTLSESAAALVLVALPLHAHGRLLGARAVWASRRAGVWLCIAWLTQAALVSHALREEPRARARLTRQMAYDAVLWVCFWLALADRRARDELADARTVHAGAEALIPPNLS